MKIIFFGTPDFADKILEFLLDKHINIIGVVTRPDKPRGRSKKLIPSAVKNLIIKKNLKIPVFQPHKASTDEFAQKLADLKPDLFVVVAYGEIIKTNLLSIPPKGCINVHASLLPKYRGAAPMQRCLMNGDKETGVTIIEMALKMDAGDMLAVEKVSVSEDMTHGELEEKLCQLSGPLLLKVIKDLEQGGIKKIPQNEEEVTFASKITNEDRIINWQKPAIDLHNQIRALSPDPAAYSFVKIGEETKRLIVKKSKKIPNLQGSPGETLSYGKEGWIVACGKQALLLLELQLEGKKPLSIQDFTHGITQPPKIMQAPI